MRKRQKAAPWGTAFWKIGSASRTRTYDPLVNSQLLYQLSYRGSVIESGL